MGVCGYCKTDAGFLRSEHKACREKATEEVAEAQKRLMSVRDLVQDAVWVRRIPSELGPALSEVRQSSSLGQQEITKALLKGADDAAMRLAHERPINNEDIELVADIFKLIQSDFLEQSADKIVAWHGYVSLTMSNTLFQIMNGEVPYMDPNVQIGFRLGRSEHLINRRNASLAEYQTVTSGGGFQSVSMPVGGGIYYRLGASIPKSQHSGLVLVDQGSMAITTEALYFGGERETFRIPLSSIIRLEPYNDAVAVYENFGAAKVFIPGTLGFEDGWYFYNLLYALIDRANEI